MVQKRPEKKEPSWGFLLLVTMTLGLLPLETLQEQGIEYFLQPHLLLHAGELFPSPGIYSLAQIYLSWMELNSFIDKQGLDIPVRTSQVYEFAPPV